MTFQRLRLVKRDWIEFAFIVRLLLRIHIFGHDNGCGTRREPSAPVGCRLGGTTARRVRTFFTYSSVLNQGNDLLTTVTVTLREVQEFVNASEHRT